MSGRHSGRSNEVDSLRIIVAVCALIVMFLLGLFAGLYTVATM